MSIDSKHRSPEPRKPTQPYLDWALATRFGYLRKGAWIPLLIEFDAKEAQRSQEDEKLTALQAFATRRWLSDEPRSLDEKLIIPELFANPPKILLQPRASHLNFCVVLIRRDPDIVRELMQLDGWKRTVLRVDLGPPVDLADKNSSPITSEHHVAVPSVPAATPSRTTPARKRRIRQSLLSAFKRLIPFAGARFVNASDSISSALASTPPQPGTSASTGSPGGAPAQRVDQSSAPARSGSTAPGRVDRVVIAVIDQGVAFANSRFFSGDEPRIEYLWQQDVLGTTMPVAGLTMNLTPGFELEKVKIKDAVAEARKRGAGDEWVYREYGGLSFAVDGYKPLARRRAHGTHVLDLAAGGTDASKHPIIAVDMPEDAVGDPSGSTLSVQAAWAIIYILDRAEKLRKPNEKLPVVVNLSYGPHEGAHDGTASLELFMDEIWQLADASETPLEIVLAAGNFRQTRTHAVFDLAAATDKPLQWRLQPGSLAPSLMEIWLPAGSDRQTTVTLTPPPTSAFLTPVTVSANDPDKPVTNASNNVLYQAKYELASGSVKADSIVLSIARTAPDPAGAWGDAVAPSGLWRVTLNAKTPVNGVKAWIRRSETLSGRRAKGRQSYFDDSKIYRRLAPNGRPNDFDPQASTSYVRRYQTLSGIATGEHTRVIGGYRHSDCYPSLYSSHGTHLKAAVEEGPDWLECSDDSDALPGVLAAGTASGSVSVMNGSSVAAPQATRWIAHEWVTAGKRPVGRTGLLPIALYPDRPIPPLELPFAAGKGRARYKPRWPLRR